LEHGYFISIVSALKLVRYKAVVSIIALFYDFRGKLCNMENSEFDSMSN